MLLKALSLTERKEGLKTPSMVVVLLLPILMLATRTDHFGSAVSLPDASLAVFLLAGFYLRRFTGFILLCGLAAGIDYWAISVRGVSDYCVTAAYGFLLPTYLSVWWAGRWARTHTDHKFLLVLVTIASVLVSFVISNGSFYLFSGYFSELGLVEYVGRTAQYLPRYLLSPLGYLAVTVLFHLLLTQKKSRQQHCHD